MFSYYIVDKQGFTQDLIAPIVNNKKLPKDIRDSWIETAVTMNVDKLYNTPDEQVYNPDSGIADRGSVTVVSP